MNWAAKIVALCLVLSRSCVDGSETDCPNGYDCMKREHCHSTVLKACDGYGFVCCASDSSQTSYDYEKYDHPPSYPRETYGEEPYSGPGGYNNYEPHGDRESHSYNYDRDQNYGSDNYPNSYRPYDPYSTIGKPGRDQSHYGTSYDDGNDPYDIHGSPVHENNYETEHSYQSPYSPSHNSGNRNDRYDRYSPSYGDQDSEGYEHERLNYRDYYESGYNGPRMSHEAVSYIRNYKSAEECGVQRTLYGDRQYRVSTGSAVDSGITEYGEFPWHAAIFFKADEKVRTPHGYLTGYKYHCGGTVINSGIVLTAAHCVAGFRKSELKVKLGDWNLKGSRGEMFPAVSRKLRKVIVHEKYDSSRFENDVALLVLDRPVHLKKTPHISPACLPPSDLKMKQYSKCYIAGWGEDSFKPNYGSNFMKKASVNLLKREECKVRIQRSVSNLVSDFFHDSHRCFTGGYGKDACLGDGGGAVVCPIPNDEVKICDRSYGCEGEHFFIAGVISWGHEDCGTEDSVTVISDMVYLRDWVDDVLRHAGGVESYDHRYWSRENYASYPPHRYGGSYGYNRNS